MSDKYERMAGIVNNILANGYPANMSVVDARQVPCPVILQHTIPVDKHPISHEYLQSIVDRVEDKDAVCELNVEIPTSRPLHDNSGGGIFDTPSRRFHHLWW